MTELERLLRGGPAAATGAGEAARRMVDRADAAGLLDVAYADVDSPFGPLTVAVTARGVLRVAYPDRDRDAVLSEIADRVSPRVLEAPARVDQARRQLEEYFEGRRSDFELPIDWRLEPSGFGTRVLRATARIPAGRVATYRDVATRAGSPRAVRAAGNALGANRIPIVVPCHRVVRTGGALGGYTGGVERKKLLLRLEGVLE
jgi:methylated-DNA-[protein]-cysteine S-methyltransferase